MEPALFLSLVDRTFHKVLQTMSPTPKDLEVVSKLATILKELGAPMNVVATVSSWGDTLDSDDVLNLIGEYTPARKPVKSRRLRFGVN